MLSELRELSKTDDEYEIIYKIMKDIKDPETFYQKVKDSRVFYNFFEWYRNPDNYGGFIDRKDIAKTILYDFNIPHKKYLYTEINPKNRRRELYGKRYKGKYVRKK